MTRSTRAANGVAVSDDQLVDEVVKRYSTPHDSVRLVYAPYRICPLGAHVDHQQGCVLSLAIDRGIRIAYTANNDGELNLASLDVPGPVSFRLSDVGDRVPDDWGNYPRGAVRVLQRHRQLQRGFSGVVSGELVGGGGLSSSAALGIALLLSLEQVNSLTVSPMENIRLDQALENDYLGLRNGVLDPSAILMGRRDQLTQLDCLTLEHQWQPMPPNMPRFSIVIASSGMQRSLVRSDYNLRVGECTAAAKALLQAAGRDFSQPTLRQVHPDEYSAYRGCLDSLSARRAQHFFSEQERVQCGVEAWRHGDMARFGQLMMESGFSSIENYECGAPPLIDLHLILSRLKGVWGCRFSGAGFGGCCVALVDPAAVEQISHEVRARYAERYPELAQRAAVQTCNSDDGARYLR